MASARDGGNPQQLPPGLTAKRPDLEPCRSKHRVLQDLRGHGLRLGASGGGCDDDGRLRGLPSIQAVPSEDPEGAGGSCHLHQRLDHPAPAPGGRGQDESGGESPTQAEAGGVV